MTMRVAPRHSHGRCRQITIAIQKAWPEKNAISLQDQVIQLAHLTFSLNLHDSSTDGEVHIFISVPFDRISPLDK